MNALQSFMAAANAQLRDVIQEAAEINGMVVYGTFSDQQLIPVMTRHGYEDHLVTEFKAEANQFPSPPIAKGSLLRPQTSQNFFVQMVDAKNPVVYTFILTDREL